MLHFVGVWGAVLIGSHLLGSILATMLGIMTVKALQI
jgi:hypothetical protein